MKHLKCKILAVCCVIVAVAGCVTGTRSILQIRKAALNQTASSTDASEAGSRSAKTLMPAPTKKPTPESTATLIPTEEPTPEPTPAGNGHIVAIDPGHQAQGNSGQEPIGPGAAKTKAKVADGTTGKVTGIPEYQLNLDVSLKLRDELSNRGYEVIMIRETNDVDISNAKRAEIANNSGAQIFLRIHANGSDSSLVSGSLTMAPTSSNPYVNSISEACQQLSQCVVDASCAATGFKNLGVQNYDNMSGINWCQIPVTIVEMGFMTNPAEDAAMQDSDIQDKMAAGIADGVDNYFGI